MTVSRVPSAVRLYCRLLRLYPAPFRRQFAFDMAADMADGYRMARSSGRLLAGRFLCRAYSDLAISLCHQLVDRDRAAIAGWSLGAAMLLWGGTIWIAAQEWPRGPARGVLYLQLLVVFAILGATACIGVDRLMRREPLSLKLRIPPSLVL